MTDGDWISMGMRPNGKPMFRVAILGWIARLVGVQFNIGGQPYGASYERAINHAPRRDGTTALTGNASAADPVAG